MGTAGKQTSQTRRFIWGFKRFGRSHPESPGSGGASPYRAGAIPQLTLALLPRLSKIAVGKKNDAE
jgi:hypothetical protein